MDQFLTFIAAFSGIVAAWIGIKMYQDFQDRKAAAKLKQEIEDFVNSEPPPLVVPDPNDAAIDKQPS